MEAVAKGEEASFLRLQTRKEDAHASAEGWQHSAELRNRSARVTSSTPWQCDREKGTCTGSAKITIPSYATPDGDRLLAPLEIFGSGVEWNMPADLNPAERSGDVEIGESFALVEELRLHAAPGYKFDAPPPPVSQTADFGSASLKAAEQGDVMVVTRQGALAMGGLPKARFAAVLRLINTYRSTRNETVRLVKTPATPTTP